MNQRKQLKKEYLESKRPMGVYRVLNTENGKCLVGSSANLPAILKRIEFELKMGNHRNGALQSDWESYGVDAFAFEVLETLEPEERSDYNPTEDLNVLEGLWLEKLSPFAPNGYNGLRVGVG